MAASKDKFNEAIMSAKIPVLILDNKWHRLFGKMDPTDEIKELERQLSELLKRQGKINSEMKDLKKIKSNLMQEIVENMDGMEGVDSGSAVDKKLADNKRLINEVNEKMEEYEDECIELPRMIDKVNKSLMLETMAVCYERLNSNTEEIEEISEWIKEIRVTLKKNIVKKQDMELYNAQLYAYMHDIFGPQVMEMFDMKYIPSLAKMQELKAVSAEDVQKKMSSDSNANNASS